ncbi:coiled-coil domain-containing protein 55-domain containing protein [Gymnopilus junonius]|uniref:Coiled-coil domain-containing protein 55-domain containing protein n=1 Tax=Gymnopilus junonius TaxID=109634 RepID=A0A9P5NZS8_GYMJU|nr:coiled-coil domain-containing protein 55-domain containing protein [Gymnopilus junonius]
MKLSISLNKPKSQAVKSSAPLARPLAFSIEVDDDVDEQNEPKISKTGRSGPLPHSVESSKAMQKRMAAEKMVDETVYEYDEVWDKMQEAKQRLQAAKEADAAVRKPKYIQGLLSSAATRKLDHLRAEEKMMQREREAEGDLYQDKESFVTQAYKEQMEEVRRAEEEEKRREEARKKQGGSSTGLTHFYRQLLEESAQKHEATVAATEKRFIGPQGPKPNLTIVKPADFTPLADAELARLAREQGKEVELNDDNQIVDKRELLSAGLNLSLPNTRRLGVGLSFNKSQGQGVDASQAHRAVGSAASKKEINERRAREIKQQLEEEQKRREQARQESDAQDIQRIVTKRNTETDVDSARARYLERKRRKLDERAEEET